MYIRSQFMDVYISHKARDEGKEENVLVYRHLELINNNGKYMSSM